MNWSTCFEFEFLNADPALPPLELRGTVVKLHSGVTVGTKLSQTRYRSFRSVGVDLFNFKGHQKPKLHISPNSTGQAHKYAHRNMRFYHNESFQQSCGGSATSFRRGGRYIDWLISSASMQQVFDGRSI